MDFLLVIFVGGIFLAVRSMLLNNHGDQIEEYLKTINATLLYYDRRTSISEIGPFKKVGRYNVVYCFDYEIDGQRKKGWVKFLGTTGHDWRL